MLPGGNPILREQRLSGAVRLAGAEVSDIGDEAGVPHDLGVDDRVQALDRWTFGRSGEADLVENRSAPLVAQHSAPGEAVPCFHRGSVEPLHEIDAGVGEHPSPRLGDGDGPERLDGHLRPDCRGGPVALVLAGLEHLTRQRFEGLLAVILGPRIGKFNKDGTPNAFPGHNRGYVVIGTLVLVFGWMGFNPGSTFGATDLRISVVAVNTLLAG